MVRSKNNRSANGQQATNSLSLNPTVLAVGLFIAILLTGCATNFHGDLRYTSNRFKVGPTYDEYRPEPSPAPNTPIITPDSSRSQPDSVNPDSTIELAPPLEEAFIEPVLPESPPPPNSLESNTMPDPGVMAKWSVVAASIAPTGFVVRLTVFCVVYIMENYWDDIIDWYMGNNHWGT